MNLRPEQTTIYHITDVENLASILAAGGLWSDARLAQQQAGTVIGYTHIKERRMKEIQVPCCQNRFVGEFVPFYFCPRSPMLFTLNRGNTGRPEGCQRTVVHLVSNVAAGIRLGRPWAVSDGNAGAFYTSFHASLEAIAALGWSAIQAMTDGAEFIKKRRSFWWRTAFPGRAFRRSAVAMQPWLDRSAICFTIRPTSRWSVSSPAGTIKTPL